MSFPLRNCIQCKEILRADDESLCNVHLMEMIRRRRPSFVTVKRDYPEIIREKYVQDPVTKVWRRKTAT
jgi:hypothetical protein